MLSSVTLVATIKAAPWPNLPTTTVQLTVEDGTTSYFDSTLSGIDAGFDVHNGIYPGWCVEGAVTMERSVSHDVTLYSSLIPPTALADIDWTAINYILNHKQGTMMDVQNAIWFIIGDPVGTLSPAAQAMVDEANDNPNYDSATGAVLAVICLGDESDNGVQDSIIELRKPCIPGLSPGFWKHNIGVYLGYKNGAYSSPYEGFDKATMPTFLEALAAAIPVDLEDAYTVLSTGGGGAIAQARLDMANDFNAAAGFLPYIDE